MGVGSKTDWENSGNNFWCRDRITVLEEDPGFVFRVRRSQGCCAVNDTCPTPSAILLHLFFGFIYYYFGFNPVSFPKLKQAQEYWGIVLEEDFAAIICLILWITFFIYSSDLRQSQCKKKKKQNVTMIKSKKWKASFRICLQHSNFVTNSILLFFPPGELLISVLSHILQTFVKD